MNRSAAVDAELDDIIDAAVSFGNHPTDTGRGRVHNMVGRWLDGMETGNGVTAQPSVPTELVRFELNVELPVTVSVGGLLTRLADYLKARELRVVTTAVETTDIPRPAA